MLINPDIVKQAIAAQKVIPFYRFILKNDRQFGTPAGALVLHCIFTTVMIIVTVVVHPDGYNLVLAIFTYGHTIVASKLPGVLSICECYYSTPSYFYSSWSTSILTLSSISRSQCLLD